MIELNQSGQRPLEYKVIIKMPNFQEKTSGGILLPEKLKDDLGYAQANGILVACGGKAFNDFPENDIPKIGDIVSFRAYSGIKIGKEESKDNCEYRVMLDKELITIINK